MTNRKPDQSEKIGRVIKCWCPQCDSVMEIESADTLAEMDGEVE